MLVFPGDKVEAKLKMHLLLAPWRGPGRRPDCEPLKT